MLDLGRALERRAYYRDCIDFLADRGANTLLLHLTDDQGCAIRLDCVPDAASPNAYSPDEVRELDTYALSRGIRLVPEVATLGHTVYLTRLPRFRHLAETTEMFTSLCPVAPETRPLIRSIVEEVVGLFASPDVHVGLDETNFGANPLTAAALKTRSRRDLFADYIRFLHDVVTGLNRRMWMWADGLLHDPLLAGELPRDIVMCNWRYRPEEPTNTTQGLLDAGFDVMLCSAAISSQQMLFPGERFALPNVRSLRKHTTLTGRGRVLGQINTVWTPVRFMADAIWLGLDLTLALMRDENVDVPATITNFGREFYGLADTDAFVAASQSIVALSPRRDEWVGVLSLDKIDHDAVAQAAPAWADASSRLALDVRPNVRKHHEAFETFCLMAELASHCYATANAFEDLDDLAATRAADETARLLARVDANWDRERFAEDPRKYAAPIHYFDDDHLIPVIRRGLDRLRQRAAAIQEIAR